MYLFFLKLSRFTAYLGGLMLVGLIVLTCLSVIGRSLNGTLHEAWLVSLVPGFSKWMIAIGVGPINGDFELVEAGIAFSIFAFLPLCHITGGHASVDIFTKRFSDRTNRWLRLLTDVVFAAVLIMITVQLASGTASKFRTGQTTFLIEFPLWWAYALSLSAAIVTSVVATFVAVTRIRETISGTLILPVDLGAGH